MEKEFLTKLKTKESPALKHCENSQPYKCGFQLIVIYSHIFNKLPGVFGTT
jgi:hypothetical protein